MTKYLFLFSLSVFIINDIYAQPINMERLNLKGNVKILKLSEYDAKEKNGEILRNGTIIPLRSLTFDIQGNLEEQNIYNKDSSLRVKIIYSYDKGKLQEKKVYNKDATLKATIIYNYNDKGNLVDIKRMVNNDQKFIVKNTYNDKNQLMEESGYDGNGLVFKHVYSYDNQGNKIGINFFNKNNLLFKKATFQYNSNNQLLINILKSEEQVNPNMGGNRVYDRAGHQSRRPHRFEEYIDGQEIYTYNEDGNKATMQYNENGQLYSKSIFSYDNQGNEIEEITYFYEDDAITNILVQKTDIIYY